MHAWLAYLDVGPPSVGSVLRGHNAHLQLFDSNYEGMRRKSACACRVMGYGDPHC